MKKIIAALFAAMVSTAVFAQSPIEDVTGRFEIETIEAQVKYTHKINTNYGGNIAKFVDEYETLRDAGARVELRGTCVSACTLMLGIFNREDICAGPMARWAFHSASQPTALGSIFSYEGTRFIWQMYPDDVREKLIEKGWDGEKDTPHPELIYFKGTDFVRPCN